MIAIGSDDYKRRRKQLSREISGGLLVVTAYELMQQMADMSHPFRQEANFLYLSGIDEPGWQIMYDGMRDKCWAVRPKRSEVEILFGGDLSDQDVIKLSGVDEVIAESDFDSELRQMKRRHASVYAYKPSLEHNEFINNPAQKRLTSRLERIFSSVHDIERELSNMRAVKEPQEITLMRRAIAITSEAFSTIQNSVDEFRHEYDVEAIFWSRFRSSNASHAYAPIVASGENATILHYGKNNAKLQRRKLLLMDCGAVYEGYCADITRTIAIGEPTKTQQETYSHLLQAHKQIIKRIKPGLSFREYQKQVDEIMKRALCSAGLLSGINDETGYRKYFPHAISHGLGIDVHESLGSTGYFKPGMVLTVEPGIYDSATGLGMRIEDNILVTKTGQQNLSRALSTQLM